MSNGHEERRNVSTGAGRTDGLPRRAFLHGTLAAAATLPLAAESVRAATPAGAASGADRLNPALLPDQSGLGILNYKPTMRYRPMGNTGKMVSALGYGTLRLPMVDGRVDFDRSVAMVRRAIDGGVNYVDSGRVYLGGQSEQLVARALAGGYRDRVYVTSKSPWWILEKPGDFEKQFDISRKTMNTDVIDFYLVHMIMHRGWEEKVVPFRLIEKMENLKAKGLIRHMGFSFHDGLRLFKQVLAAGPWDFCLVQHNYLDYEYEAGVAGIKYAAANGLGVAVMKPVRTGVLAHLPAFMRKPLDETGIRRTDAQWALDYLWDIPEVSVAVSGMGDMKDVEENLAAAKNAVPGMFTSAERVALGRVIAAYRGVEGSTGCVGCYQCIPCPENVAIGYILSYVYNNYLIHRDLKRATADYTVSMSPVQRGDPASSCTRCGQCLPKCPQGLDIPALLAKVEKVMGR